MKKSLYNDKPIPREECVLYKRNALFFNTGQAIPYNADAHRQAIDAIIHFGTEQHKLFFVPSEIADVKNVVQEYGETTEQQNMVGAWHYDYARAARLLMNKRILFHIDTQLPNSSRSESIRN